MSHHIAAIDIGSNAIRMVLAEVKSIYSIKIKKKWRIPIRIGHDVFEKGGITPRTTSDVIDAFKSFRKVLKKHKVTQFRAVATSALREATNRREFQDKVFRKTLVPIQIISGLEEAHLIFTAITRKVSIESHHVLMIDIGGGSVELSFAKNGDHVASQSFPLGTVRILENLRKKSAQAITENDIRKEIELHIAPLQNFILANRNGKPLKIAIGTGGNIESLANLKRNFLFKVPDTFLTIKELAEIRILLESLTITERIRKLKLRPDRADVIMPAAILIEKILELAAVDRILVPRVGLKDGILCSLVQ